MVMKQEIDIEDCTIKGEPISEPSSPNAPTSPSNSLVNDNSNSIITIEPHTLHFSQSQAMQSDSEMEEDEEEMYQVKYCNFHHKSRIIKMFDDKFVSRKNRFHSLIILMVAFY